MKTVCYHYGIHMHYVCVYETKYHKDFCSHIVRVHKNDPRFLVYCQIGECSFSTKVWNSYKHHIGKHHKNIIVLDTMISHDYDDDHHVEVLNNGTSDTDPSVLNAVYLLGLETRHNLMKSKTRKDLKRETSIVFPEGE